MIQDYNNTNIYLNTFLPDFHKIFALLFLHPKKYIIISVRKMVLLLNENIDFGKKNGFNKTQLAYLIKLFESEGYVKINRTFRKNSRIKKTNYYVLTTKGNKLFSDIKHFNITGEYSSGLEATISINFGSPMLVKKIKGKWLRSHQKQMELLVANSKREHIGISKQCLDKKESQGDRSQSSFSKESKELNEITKKAGWNSKEIEGIDLMKDCQMKRLMEFNPKMLQRVLRHIIKKVRKGFKLKNLFAFAHTLLKDAVIGEEFTGSYSLSWMERSRLIFSCGLKGAGTYFDDGVHTHQAITNLRHLETVEKLTDRELRVILSYDFQNISYASYFLTKNINNPNRKPMRNWKAFLLWALKKFKDIDEMRIAFYKKRDEGVVN